MACKTATQSLTEYVLARSAAAGMDAFPLDANLRTASWIARAVEPLDTKHRGRASEHLRLAFPDWSPEQVRACHRASVEHLVRLALEVVQTPRLLGPQTWERFITFRGMKPALEVLRSGGPCLLVTGHLGNWELLGRVVALMGFPISAVYRPLDNPLLDGWIAGTRARLGLGLISKSDGVAGIGAALDRGDAVAVVADQNAGNRGLFVPFFGRLASAHRSVALMAIRRRLPIICGYAHRVGWTAAGGEATGGVRYEVGVGDVIRPEEWADHPDRTFYLTARTNRAIERMVRRRPEQYFWMHRRWKSRPAWERAGEPAPAALRDSLQSLPWMTDPEMQRLLA